MKTQYIVSLLILVLAGAPLMAHARSANIRVCSEAELEKEWQLVLTALRTNTELSDETSDEAFTKKYMTNILRCWQPRPK